jgi:hypothetical protein
VTPTLLESLINNK